jgi:ABC-type multidrug transport system fused ATPase/permease subunit
LDIILGLLEPNSGSLFIDNEELNKYNAKDWQKNIGYVPQQIFLNDQTIANNIGFGVAREKIDMDKVVASAKIANLHDYIVRDLPEGYNTFVGERGVRLSGGQIQRIGIARALYKNPSILILDEATSALDNITEKYVMDAVANLKNSITIIIVAHRLSTVKNCDKIFLFEGGSLVGEGSYDDLLQNNSIFNKMANPKKV